MLGMIVLLIIALLLGATVGWLLCWTYMDRKLQECRAILARQYQSMWDLEVQLEDTKTKLKERSE